MESGRQPRHAAPEAAFPQAVRYLVMTLGVAALVATLFTASTPEALSPGRALARWFGPQEPAPPPLAEITGSPPAPAERRIGVVIGHLGPNPSTGFVDPGATCEDGLTELQVNERIGLLVARGLQAADLTVDVLQEFDERLVEYRAMALVSIHADECTYINERATGFKVAAAVDSAVPDQSQRLVACIADRYARATGMRFHAGSITRDMTEYHTFYEIHSSTPAAIIETGFLYLDRDFLTQKPELAARGIVEGVLCYVNNEPASLDWSAQP